METIERRVSHTPPDLSHGDRPVQRCGVATADDAVGHFGPGGGRKRPSLMWDEGARPGSRRRPASSCARTGRSPLSGPCHASRQPVPRGGGSHLRRDLGSDLARRWRRARDGPLARRRYSPGAPPPPPARCRSIPPITHLVAAMSRPACDDRGASSSQTVTPRDPSRRCSAQRRGCCRPRPSRRARTST